MSKGGMAVKALWDWNGNGKDDWFDRHMDYYVYKHTFGKDDGKPKQKHTKPKPTPAPKQESYSSDDSHPIVAAIVIIGYIILSIVGGMTIAVCLVSGSYGLATAELISPIFIVIVGIILFPFALWIDSLLERFSDWLFK